MKKKFVFVDQGAGRKFQVLIEQLSCPVCIEDELGDLPDLSRFRGNFDFDSRIFQIDCVNCGRRIGDYLAQETGD